MRVGQTDTIFRFEPRHSRRTPRTVLRSRRQRARARTCPATRGDPRRAGSPSTPCGSRREAPVKSGWRKSLPPDRKSNQHRYCP
jgi:hypothetical protein